MAQIPSRTTNFDTAFDPETEVGQSICAGFSPAPGGNPHELLSRRQVEAEYGITVKALERYAWAGGGPPMVKLGHRTIRYRRGDIEAFIAAHVVGAAG